MKTLLTHKFLRNIIMGSTLLLTLTACGPGSNSPSGTSNINNTITLIELNDLHAHLEEHYDYDYRDGQPVLVKRGGIARIAQAVKDIRTQQPNSLLMNIGDTFHGGVEAFYTMGNAILEPVNALGVDIGVPGNWDYAFGPGITRLRYTGQGVNNSSATIDQVNFTNLAANVESTTRQEFLPPTAIKEVNGVRIGFIGLSSDIVPRMFPGLAIGFNFIQGKQAHLDLIEQHANELRAQNVDLIVVMSELGIHKDIALGNALPAGTVDIIFSAHTHEVTREIITTDSGARLVEAGNDTWLGRMDVQFNEQNQPIDFKWQLIALDENIQPDSTMQQLVDTIRAPYLSADVNMISPSQSSDQTLQQPINTVLATSLHTLDRRQALSNSFNRYATTSLKQFAGTDIAFTPGFRYDSVIPAANYLLEDQHIASGAITLEDVYRFFPVSFQLATGKITGAQLKSNMENNLTAVFSTDTFEQAGGWFDGYSGVNIELDLSAANQQRVQQLTLTDSDQVINNESVISVATCARPSDVDTGNLCGFSGFMEAAYLMNDQTQQPWSIIDFLTQQLTQSVTVSAPASNVSDISNTPMWPTSNYVQPLYGAQQAQ